MSFRKAMKKKNFKLMFGSLYFSNSFNFSNSSSFVSGLPKLPKSLGIEREKPKQGFIASLFKDAYISKNSFYLADELFSFLIHSDYLNKEFPLIKENREVEVNLMALHVILLRERFHIENSSSAINEADTILYYCKSNYFLHFAEKLNDHLPVEDFTDYYIEKYSKRVMILEKEIKTILQSGELNEDEKDIEIKKVFRKYIFMNCISEDNNYIKKLFKYFKAHRNYLASLSIIDLNNYKIHWGLSDELLMLEEHKNEIKK